MQTTGIIILLSYLISGRQKICIVPTDEIMYKFELFRLRSVLSLNICIRTSLHILKLKVESHTQQKSLTVLKYVIFQNS
jgi:hypothetical protein